MRISKQFFMTMILYIGLCFGSFIPSHAADHAITISVSIKPLYYLIRDIAGPKADIILLSSANESAHDDSITPSDIKAIRQSDIIFFISDNLEHAMVRLRRFAPDSTPYRMMASLPNIMVHDDNHQDNYTPSYLWLNPDNIMIMIPYIAEQLSAINPKQTALYRKNARKIMSDIKDITHKISTLYAPLDLDKAAYISLHNDTIYFTDYMGLSKPSTIISAAHDGYFSIHDIQRANRLFTAGVSCLLIAPQAHMKVVNIWGNNKDIFIQPIDVFGYDDVENNASLSDILYRVATAIYECLR